MRDESGYSLIELLVVLALLGLISIVMSGGARFGARVWERTGGEVESFEQTRGTQALLRSLLATAVRRPLDPSTPESTFAGDAGHMSFTSALPPSLGGGRAHVTLTAERRGEAIELLIVWRPERGSQTEQRRTLLQGARTISFAYASENEGSLTWSEAWSAATGTPALVRIRADVARSGANRWPDLIVRPRIDRDASCIFDPVSFECRRG